MNTMRKTQVKRYHRIPLPSKYKVRLKTIRIVKFMVLICFVSFFTVVVIKLMETYDPHHNKYRRRDPPFRLNKPQVNGNNMKIDWHNYEQIYRDRQRTGIGEQGEAADFSNIPKEKLDKSYKESGYNGALSDQISLFRALPDVRPPNCSNILYKKNLPTVSVILPFHNEHLSVILRTVWSIIKRSPEHLLKDITLVDDCSTKESLKDDLDNYIKNHLSSIVKILRLKSRSGLIMARQRGAKLAKGEVLVFMDSHCEANINWLPPLLDLISDNYKTCVCPIIDTLDWDTFQYIKDDGGRGGFNWNLDYERLEKFKRYSSKLSTEPYESPVMVGGLFAISAKFFWELGGYDEGLFIWGGEQFELSFKIWQCGGRLLDVPCSRVGHLYRKYGVFINPNNNTDYVCKNLKRVAEVWMDEYKQYFYQRELYCANIQHGDISKQLAIREKLNCKPFKWFMEEVAYDLTNRYPLVEPPDVARGAIRCVARFNLCVENIHEIIKMAECENGSALQEIIFNWKGEIKGKNSKYCWDVIIDKDKKIKLNLYLCHSGAGNQLWKYDEVQKHIKHSDTNNCLELDSSKENELLIRECVKGKKSQEWILENFNKTQHDRISEYVKNIVIEGKPPVNIT